MMVECFNVIFLNFEQYFFHEYFQYFVHMNNLLCFFCVVVPPSVSFLSAIVMLFISS